MVTHNQVIEKFKRKIIGEEYGYILPVYGPLGVGKTSLTNHLIDIATAKYELSKDEVVHVVEIANDMSLEQIVYGFTSIFNHVVDASTLRGLVLQIDFDNYREDVSGEQEEIIIEFSNLYRETMFKHFKKGIFFVQFSDLDYHIQRFMETYIYAPNIAKKFDFVMTTYRDIPFRFPELNRRKSGLGRLSPYDLETTSKMLQESGIDTETFLTPIYEISLGYERLIELCVEFIKQGFISQIDEENHRDLIGHLYKNFIINTVLEDLDQTESDFIQSVSTLRKIDASITMTMLKEAFSDRYANKEYEFFEINHKDMKISQHYYWEDGLHLAEPVAHVINMHKLYNNPEEFQRDHELALSFYQGCLKRSYLTDAYHNIILEAIYHLSFLSSFEPGIDVFEYYSKNLSKFNQQSKLFPLITKLETDPDLPHLLGDKLHQKMIKSTQIVHDNLPYK